MRRNHHVFGHILLILCLSWSLPAWAASGLVILDNPLRHSFTGFASSLAVVGDLDGDQVSDYLVGAYEHYWNDGMGQGRAFVFSGQTGQLLFPLDLPYRRHDAALNPHHGPAFGFAVAAAGDVNRDGVPDLLIGAFGHGEKGNNQPFALRGPNSPVGKDMLETPPGTGQAFVFSGKGGELLYSLAAPQLQPGAGFGWSVASLGDLTDDEVPELIVGALAQDGQGRVFVFNGQDGALVWTLAPPSSSGSMAFGWSVANAGDLDTDNIPDILVGAPYTMGDEIPLQGQVYAFSGRTGTLLYIIDDPYPTAGAGFGWSVASGGDLNQDGVPDVLVGAPYKDIGANRSQGAAFIFSGVDGTLLFPLHNPAPTKPYSGFGLTVATSPDVNQDGIPEILVGAPYQTVDQFHVQGEVFLFNGRDGRHLTTFDNPFPHQGSMFGYTVVSPGDVNGDQIPDFAIGAAGQSFLDKVAVGRVYVVLSQTGHAEGTEEGRLRMGQRNAK